MKRSISIISLLTVLCSCGRPQVLKQEEYSKQVGEIAFDEKTDDAAFKIADTIMLFYKPVYEGGKPAIVNHFKEKYKSKDYEKINGYITIRFYVNSEGKAGKFRIQTMNFKYQKVEFDQAFNERILQLTRELKAWKPLSNETQTYGYYSYLNFKIMNGEIKEITP